MATASTQFMYKHLVVVHGIGDQVPNETSLNFMNHFLRALPRGEGHHLEVKTLIQSVHSPDAKRSCSRFDPSYVVFTNGTTQYVIGFSEVFWQDITYSYLAGEGKIPPIPIFIWAHSVNTRLLRNGNGHNRNFYEAREAIDNLESILKLVAALARIYKRSAQFLMILNRFLGDVQMYTESEEIRGKINGRFKEVMERVGGCQEKAAKELGIEFSFAPEIYVVAHSEGTVVSYSSLVEARKEKKPWFDQVRGLVTLGSPLDKHYTIWNNCFHTDTGVKELPPADRIRWFNYWDVSDPVGYGLQTLQRNSSPSTPAAATDAAKLFTICYDEGFARYPLPGLAHVAYWDDFTIYENIIEKVMGMGSAAGRNTRVTSKWFGHGPIQQIGDRAAYLFVRGTTLVAITYFLVSLLAEFSPRVPCNFFESSLPYVTYALWLFLPPVICKLLWEAYARNDGLVAKAALWARRILWAVWLAILAAVSWNLAVRFPATEPPPPPQVKDIIGYATGLLTSILGWKLHTRVHKGLVQLWRYTKSQTAQATENQDAYNAAPAPPAAKSAQAPG